MTAKTITANALTTIPATVDGIAMDSSPGSGFAAGHLYLQADDGADKRNLMEPEGGHGSNAVETMILRLVEWYMTHAVR